MMSHLWDDWVDKSVFIVVDNGDTHMSHTVRIGPHRQTIEYLTRMLILAAKHSSQTQASPVPIAAVSLQERDVRPLKLSSKKHTKDERWCHEWAPDATHHFRGPWLALRGEKAALAGGATLWWL